MSELKKTALKNIFAPRGFAAGIHGGGDANRIFKAYRHQSITGGDDSLLMWPIRVLGAKILPKKARYNLMTSGWKMFGEPALRADTYLGSKLEKIPGIGKKLFRIQEDVPWGRGMKKEVTRSSALAPLVKARNIAEPILVGVGLDKGIQKLRNINKPETANQDQHLREKVASVMLHLHEQNKGHEKRAHALRLLFKQAEMGLMQLPQSHSELETKLASLVTEDLVVLEKALELTGGNIKLGELGHLDAKSAVSPVEKFQATILGDEI